MLSIARGIASVSSQTWNAPHIVNVARPAMSRQRELRYVDSYLGMGNDTEKDRQCSRHLEIEYGCHLNEMEIYYTILYYMARMAVFNVAGYLITEESRRSTVISASPRGQCSK